MEFVWTALLMLLQTGDDALAGGLLPEVVAWAPAPVALAGALMTARSSSPADRILVGAQLIAAALSLTAVVVLAGPDALQAGSWAALSGALALSALARLQHRRPSPWGLCAVGGWTAALLCGALAPSHVLIAFGVYVLAQGLPRVTVLHARERREAEVCGA